MESATVTVKLVEIDALRDRIKQLEESLENSLEVSKKMEIESNEKIQTMIKESKTKVLQISTVLKKQRIEYYDTESIIRKIFNYYEVPFTKKTARYLRKIKQYLQC